MLLAMLPLSRRGRSNGVGTTDMAHHSLRSIFMLYLAPGSFDTIEEANPIQHHPRYLHILSWAACAFKRVEFVWSF